jgi:hypothetical protein
VNASVKNGRQVHVANIGHISSTHDRLNKKNNKDIVADKWKTTHNEHCIVE